MCCPINISMQIIKPCHVTSHRYTNLFWIQFVWSSCKILKQLLVSAGYVTMQWPNSSVLPIPYGKIQHTGKRIYIFCEHFLAYSHILTYLCVQAQNAYIMSSISAISCSANICCTETMPPLWRYY